MDIGTAWDTTRWFGRPWLARASAMLAIAALALGYHYANVRFVPMALGMFLFAAVCYFECGRRDPSAVRAIERRTS